MTPDALTLLPYPDKRKKLEKVLLIIISVTIIQKADFIATGNN